MMFANLPRLILLAIVVHTVVFLSVFDIYFQSPVIHGMRPVFPPFPAPSHRLVLFVADGLRADKCFGAKTEEGQWAAEYLRSVVELKGVWGVSFTRVPTESRPGHVALIAGFYEDVSAVTRGWKENPVDFDSVFNQSRNTWCWGSPDILPMFARGTSASRVFTHFYDAKEENFADSNPSRLDTWVFDRFQEFLSKAKHNSTLKLMLSKDKVIFFLHLLGLDTMGHSRKPWSKEYVTAIQVVDHGIQNTVAAIEDFYNHDSATSFIFTSDHGMTDWGSHGSSDPEETNTPFIAWGAGIREPVLIRNRPKVITSNRPSEWQLSHTLQTNIEQADIAPLMATLIGVPYPLNSVGVLPTNLLSGSEHFKAQSLLKNAEQIGQQFEQHWKLKEKHALPLLFRPYSKLSLNQFHSKVDHILKQLDTGHYDSAMKETQHVISDLLQGIRYFETYYRIPLGACILFGFLGWMVYLGSLFYEGHLSLDINSKKLDRPTKLANSFTYAFMTLAVVTVLLSFYKRDPVSYYLYYLLPISTWYLVVCRLRVITHALGICRSHFMRTVILSFLLSVAVELLVLVFFVREVLSLILVIMSIWPFTIPTNDDKKISFLWLISCWGLATFPLLPPVGRDLYYNLVIFAGVLAFLVAMAYFVKFQLEDQLEIKSKKWISLAQIPIILVATGNVWMVSFTIKADLQVPFLNHAISWLILGVSFIFPLFGSSRLLHRIFSVFVSLLMSFILFCSSYEVFMFMGLICLLLLWLMLENKTKGLGHKQLLLLTFQDQINHSLRQFDAEDIRRAYFSLFILSTSFFALGNVPNVNSFSPTSIYCFVTIFSPFLMGALLLCKILLPFLAVATTLRAIQASLRRPPAELFWSLLLLCDIMVVNFFFLVRDEGSWLEIGSSIGRFVVVMVTTIAFILLYGLSTLLTNPLFIYENTHQSLPLKLS